jgi:uroporphyrin-3 C-methyltransferase
VGEFFASDEAAARALASELRQLMDQTVQVALPDTTRSLRALEEAVSQRATAAGGV